MNQISKEVIHVHFFHRFFPIPTHGFDRKHPSLHELPQARESEKTPFHYLQRTDHRTPHHPHLQLYRGCSDEILTSSARHDTSCWRSHPVPHLSKDDFPTKRRSSRSPSSRRTIHSSLGDPLSSRSCSPCGCDDLRKARAEQISDGRRHHDGLGSVIDRSSFSAPIEKGIRTEGNHRDREADGSSSGSDFDSDVPKWSGGVHRAHSYSLTIAYDGTFFYGWQKTRSGPSIQEELEKALEVILHDQVNCEAASRTDRGVHAFGQVVQFYTDKQPQAASLQISLNGLLPKTIRVKECKQVPLNFHPTLDAKEKTYHYTLDLNPIQDPFHAKTSWHQPNPIDVKKMEAEASNLLGTHDFSRFTTELRNSPICTLSKISFTLLPNNLLQIALTGNRFLYKMARRLSGTLAQIGSGKIQPNEVGMTAPAHGLSLYNIQY
jgi:tRNA pseudouridine38-40 synthase